MLQRALRGEPAYLADEDIRPGLYVEPGKLVLTRVKWAGYICRKCQETAVVEVVVEPPEFVPRPRGQLMFWEEV